MKATLLSLGAAFALTLSATAADVTVKLTDMHICCKTCVTRAEKAVNSVSGAKPVVSQDDETVTITAPDKATAQKAVNALLADGFFGKTDDKDIKISSVTGAKNAKVKSVEITDLHLCCNKCVSA